MEHTRGAPHHPMTKGNFERWHQTLKNRFLLENDCLPRDLEARIDAFVSYFYHQRYHESLDNLKPADVCFCHGQRIVGRVTASQIAAASAASVLPRLTYGLT